jgi:hypothetical protein
MLRGISNLGLFLFRDDELVPRIQTEMHAFHDKITRNNYNPKNHKTYVLTEFIKILVHLKYSSICVQM